MRILRVRNHHDDALMVCCEQIHTVNPLVFQISRQNRDADIGAVKGVGCVVAGGAEWMLGGSLVE